MILANHVHTNENFYLQKFQQLLQRIGPASSEAAEAVKSFDIQTKSDKICILTVANNFSRDLEYTLSNLQRVMIDNHKKGDNNKILKEAVLAFCTYLYSIQLAFGNDFNKLKLEIIYSLQNLDRKLDPLINIVQEHSPYTSKVEISSILDYLYTAIEKVKLRIEWENLDRKELSRAIAVVYDAVVASLDNLKDKSDAVAYYRRASHEGIQGVVQFVGEIDAELDCYDDEIRDVALKLTSKLAASVLDFDKPIRTTKNMSELTWLSYVCAVNLLPSIGEVLDILNNKNSQDVNGNLKNFILNAVVNLLSVTIRFGRDCGKIIEN